MRVLAFGTFDVRRHPRVGVLIDGLIAAGDSVEVCNEPLPLGTAERVAILRQPWRLPVLFWRLGSCWARLIRRARGVAPADVVLVGYLGHFDVVLARLLFRRTPIVLDHLVSASDTARDRGEAGSLKQVLLRGLDWLATRCADIVVVDTDEHAGLLPRRARRKALVVPVGAPAAWFAARRPADVAGSGSLRVVFFGHYTPLQGAPTIAAAIRELPPGTVDPALIGRGQDVSAARAAAGDAAIDWLDWVEPEQLPGLVALYDVCLGIFGSGPKALRVVPNKVFQGAAAGCAIVTSDTEPQRRALGDAAVYVPPGDADALATVLAALAADRSRVTDLRRRAAKLADDHFTPEAVVAPLRARLADLPSPR